MSALLLYGDSFRNPNIYYATRFLAPDPVVFAKGESGDVLMVPSLEKGRAQKEARVSEVISFDDLGFQDAVRETGDPNTAMAITIERLLERFGSVVSVEPGFPMLLADLLRGRGVELVADSDLMTGQRRVKNASEIEAIARSQARAEQAVSQAIDILREATVVHDSLIWKGVPLTAERLRSELEVSFARDNFSNEMIIVAPGAGSSDPHWDGAGPIHPREPLILDIFPQDRSSRYHGDVTRTVIKGGAPAEIVRMFESVKKAQELAVGMIRPGVSGREVHQAVVDSFASDGYDDQSDARYIHGTGHGLGLEVHELPRLSRIDMNLVVGDVVTVEPGLYDPKFGGVRIEDVVVVTAAGNRNLNRLPKELVIP